MSEPEYEHRSFRMISKSFGFSGKAGLNGDYRAIETIHYHYFTLWINGQKDNLP